MAYLSNQIMQLLGLFCCCFDPILRVYLYYMALLEENYGFRRNFYLIAALLLIFLFTTGILVYYIQYQTSVAPKASSFSVVNNASIVNSYVFASPVRAKAGGDLIRVTVFALDDQGAGVYDKKVSLTTNNSDLAIKDIQSLTDETGMALFDVSSSVPNSYELSVLIGGVLLPQKLKVLID